MDVERPRYGPLVSAVGAIALAIAVFLPWYGLSFTARGIALVQQLGQQFVSTYGNAQLQGYLGEFHASVGALAGRQFASVSAHQALKDMNVVLLILAAAGALIALAVLAGAAFSTADGHRGPLLLIGAAATLCVLYRIVSPPTPDGEVIALSLRGGAWLALAGSLAIAAGALWPNRVASSTPSEAKLESAWSELSGWTPEG